MTVFRVFSRLDVKNSYVVKGIQLDGLRRIGDPKALARRYLDFGVDELVMIDVVASLYNRPSLFSLITDIANELRIPLTGVGGVRSLEDAKEVFNSGADKVAVNSAALHNPSIFTDISRVFGSQSVVCSIEAKQTNKSHQWQCMTENGRNDSGIEISDWIPKLEDLGVGELFVTSVDSDGTNRGPDLNLCEKIRKFTELPIIYSGGIRNCEDVYEIAKREIDGVAIASALHYERINMEELKWFLSEKGVFVRTLSEDKC